MTLNRPIRYVRLSITDRCNYRCQYCMPEIGIDKQCHSDILRFEDYLDILKTLVELGAQKVRITGGEPLVRKGAVNFVKSVCDLDGIMDVGLTTNGALLEELGEPLYEAGLRRLNISLDSLKPDVFRDITRGGDLDQVLKGIEVAKAIGFDPIKINMVYMQGINDGELESFVALSDQNLEVRLIELMPIGEAAQWSKERFVKLDNLFANRTDFTREPAADSGVCRYYRHGEQGGLVGVITPISEHFCTNCDKVRITADGMLKTCLHSDEEVDLKPFLYQPEAMKTVILEALACKPQRHGLDGNNISLSARNMMAMGG